MNDTTGQRVAILLALLFSTAAPSPPAGATTGSLIFTGTTGSGTTGTSEIDVSSTAVETLTLDVVLDVDSAGVCCGMLSVEFDADLGDEVDIVSIHELGWTNAKASQSLAQYGFGIRTSQESSGSVEGHIYGLEAFTYGLGPSNTTLTFARMVFRTKPANLRVDGEDISLGEFSPAGAGNDDGVFTNSTAGDGQRATVSYSGASINGGPVEVPAVTPLGLGALLGAGLGVGVWALRRRGASREDAN